MSPHPRSLAATLAGAAALIGALTANPLSAAASETTVAIATNFTEPAREIARAFTAGSGHTLVMSFGSTGQFYTQITQDAPFTVFLAADHQTPQKLVDEGYGVAGSTFAYAFGTLVLWSKTAGLVTGADTLKTAAFEKIAIANPKVAPYGAAAMEVMTALGVYRELAPRIVQGTNIAQTFQFIETGNAELGFVALSQVINRQEGARWTVPGTLHKPIQQDAVLLKMGADDSAAMAFLEFLKEREARGIIEKYGYGVPASGGAAP